MKKIVVLGGSFGGLTAAFEVKRLLGDRAEVTLISRDQKFVFLPSLPWLIMGSRRQEDIILDVARILEPRGIAFVHQAVTGVRPGEQKVVTAGGEYAYDYLVIATGPYLACEEIPGLGPNRGYTHCTFTLDYALKSRDAWRRLLDEPGPVVIGSTQMASCFGPYYELAFEMDWELRKRKMRHKVPITYLTSEPYLGHMGVGGLGRSRRFLEDEFADLDIRIAASQAIDEITPVKSDWQAAAGSRSNWPCSPRRSRGSRGWPPSATPGASSPWTTITATPTTPISMPWAWPWPWRRPTPPRCRPGSPKPDS